ncbi:MAG: aminoglycoside adenylyltransferase domain-containing protein [Pseudonocardiaceae bacterium]
MDAVVERVVGAFLDAVDASAPGLVEGLYLVGSVALGDFRPHESDVDFVVVSARRLEVTAESALAKVHAGLGARSDLPPFEGVYLTWQDLACSPAACPGTPYACDGVFHARGDFAVDPVTWHQLAHYGLACRGPAVEEFDVWTDPDVLAAWTRANLDGYWRRWRERHRRLFTRPGWDALRGDTAAWGVLGVSRLHFTLATGGFTSKTGAGAYALEAFPARWHRVLTECSRVRRGETSAGWGRGAFARRREALDFMAMVIEDGQGVGGGSPHDLSG